MYRYTHLYSFSTQIGFRGVGRVRVLDPSPLFAFPSVGPHVIAVIIAATLDAGPVAAGTTASMPRNRITGTN